MTQPVPNHPAAALTPKPKQKRSKKVAHAVANGEPVKHRVEVVNATTKVVDTKVGPVTLVDKLKAYYHTLIIVIAAILVLLNQIVSAAHLIPGGYGGTIVGYVSTGIVVVAGILAALKSNEQWVNSL